MELLENLNIERGTTVLIGAPSIPFKKKVIDELSKITSKLKSINEVHVPQCFAVGVMNKPEKILVIVIKNDDAKEVVLTEATQLIRESKIIDNILVWILTTSSDFIDDVRAANCQLKGKKKTKWSLWKKK